MELGQIVHFVLEGSLEHRPAIVTKLYEPRPPATEQGIDLSVFLNPLDSTESVLRVNLPARDENPDPQGGTWHLPGA